MATYFNILAWRIPLDSGDWWGTMGLAKSWTRLNTAQPLLILSLLLAPFSRVLIFCPYHHPHCTKAIVLKLISSLNSVPPFHLLTIIISVTPNLNPMLKGGRLENLVMVFTLKLL